MDQLIINLIIVGLALLVLFFLLGDFIIAAGRWVVNLFRVKMGKDPLPIKIIEEVEKPESEFWGTIKVIFYAIMLALLLRSFAYEPFVIPSRSMVPTLLVGDFLFVSKYSYGYSRYSLPLHLPVINDRILEQMPERGDVVVFYNAPTQQDYIKRVIGLPGDKVQVREGILYVNDNRITKRKKNDDYFYDEGLKFRVVDQYEEKLGDKEFFTIDTALTPADNTKVYTVPAEHVFVMGDNRDNSLDSRFSRQESGVGFVHKNFLIGRAEIIFFSLDDGTRFWEIWRWPSAIRTERLMQKIH